MPTHLHEEKFKTRYLIEIGLPDENSYVYRYTINHIEPKEIPNITNNIIADIIHDLRLSELKINKLINIVSGLLLYTFDKKMYVLDINNPINYFDYTVLTNINIIPRNYNIYKPAA